MVQLAPIVIAAAAAVGTVSGAHLPAPTGADILNFALNLECLEAEFYSFAAYGKGLTATQRGGGPAPIGGRKANLTGSYKVCPSWAAVSMALERQAPAAVSIQSAADMFLLFSSSRVATSTTTSQRAC